MPYPLRTNVEINPSMMLKMRHVALASLIILLDSADLKCFYSFVGFSGNADNAAERYLISRNKWSSIVYRRGQKQLTRLFLKEAEHVLELALA